MTPNELMTALRQVRARYDALDRGETAPLRRCRTAAEVSLESAYWRTAGSLGHEQRQLAHVVLLFPLAPQSTDPRFSLGRFLARQFGDSGGAQLRFRRLLDSRDRDQLDHRLRGALRLACGDGSRVDWGVFGLDVLWFFADSDRVRRRWAQDFYAPISTRADVRTSPAPQEKP